MAKKAARKKTTRKKTARKKPAAKRKPNLDRLEPEILQRLEQASINGQFAVAIFTRGPGTIDGWLHKTAFHEHDNDRIEMGKMLATMMRDA